MVLGFEVTLITEKLHCSLSTNNNTNRIPDLDFFDDRKRT